MADEEPRKDDADEPLSTDDDSDEPELYSILRLARTARIADEKKLDAEINAIIDKAESDALIDKDLAGDDE